MSSPREEPQEARGAPGSRDTGSDEPSAGPADRPSGKYEGDESVSSHDGEGDGAPKDVTGEMPPQDTGSAVPPYEGRKEGATPGPGAGEAGGARTAGATGPVSDSGYKSPAPGSTPGGATASPADEQPAAESGGDCSPDMTGPAHVGGTGRAEDKR